MRQKKKIHGDIITIRKENLPEISQQNRFRQYSEMAEIDG